MKQRPSEKQYDEITPEQKAVFWNRMDKDIYNIEPPIIGEMIRFLGDCWCENIYIPKNNRLCDWLWKAVKDKLK